MTEIFDNIRKIYDFLPPAEALKEYVEFYSETSPDLTAQYIGNNIFSVKMFASFTPTFFINLGGSYKISLGNKLYTIGPGEDIFILRDNIAERHNLPADHIFTVKFFPGGLEAVLGISQANYTNLPVSAACLLPRQLLTQIKQPVTFEERVLIMQQYLLQCLDQQKTTNHYRRSVQKAISEFGANGLELTTGNIAENLFITSKTINRYFNRIIGVNPKKYFCIVRTRTALTGYMQDPKNFDPDKFGYYDRSHFYRDVINFTGQKLPAAIK